MDAARVLAVERRLRKSLLQNLKRNGHEPPPPTRNTTWAVVGVIPVGNPRAQPVARARANPGASTTKHSVDTRPVEEMVTNEAWDDAGAVDTVSDNTYHASASTNSMPGALTVASAPCSAPGDQTVASPTSGVTAIRTSWHESIGLSATRNQRRARFQEPLPRERSVLFGSKNCCFSRSTYLQ